MANQAQEAPGRRSHYEEITERLQRKAEEGIATLPVASCRKIIAWAEWKQQDLAMASIAADYDPQHTLLDKGRWEAYEKVVEAMGERIAEAERELQEPQEGGNA